MYVEVGHIMIVYIVSSVGRPPKVQFHTSVDPKVQFHTSVDLPKSGMLDYIQF